MNENSPETSRKRFTEVSFDKFTNKSITRWVDPMNDRTLDGKWQATFWTKNEAQQSYGTGYVPSLNAKLNMNLAFVEGQEGGHLKIFYELQTLNQMNLSQGQMIVNLDERNNINLPAELTNVKFIHGSKLRAPFCQEEGYYIITKAQLKAICDANKIAIRISGGGDHIEPDKTDLLKFQFMCRSFISEVFNDHTYDEWINKTIPSGTEGREEAGCLTMVSYLIAFFIPPLGFIMGLFLILKPRFDSNNKLRFAYSPFYQINGLLIIGVAAFSFNKFGWLKIVQGFLG